jgi:hypothetical protein
MQRGLFQVRDYSMTAMTSISTRASRGSRATCTVERAGGGEQRADVAQDLIGLRRDVAIDKYAGGGIEADLTRKKQ